MKDIKKIIDVIFSISNDRYILKENCNLDKDTLSCIFGEVSELKISCDEIKLVVANLINEMEDIKI